MSLAEIRNTISQMGQAELTSFKYQTCPNDGSVLHPTMSYSYRLLTDDSSIPVSSNSGKIKIPGHDELYFNYHFIRSAALLDQMNNPDQTVISFSINKQLAELTNQIGSRIDDDFELKMSYLTQTKVHQNNHDIFENKPEYSRWLAFSIGEKIFDPIRNGYNSNIIQ